VTRGLDQGSSARLRSVGFREVAVGSAAVARFDRRPPAARSEYGMLMPKCSGSFGRPSSGRRARIVVRPRPASAGSRRRQPAVSPACDPSSAAGARPPSQPSGCWIAAACSPQRVEPIRTDTRRDRSRPHQRRSTRESSSIAPAVARRMTGVRPFPRAARDPARTIARSRPSASDRAARAGRASSHGFRLAAPRWPSSADGYGRRRGQAATTGRERPERDIGKPQRVRSRGSRRPE